ncbi:MAG: hypothetical protein KJ971_08735, partial [Firmicutes bacterium]|nr:hypothetical protein [Bacillota bacterium]
EELNKIEATAPSSVKEWRKELKLNRLAIEDRQAYYKRLAGEIEANEAAGRMKLTPKQRREQQPYKDGIPKEEVIVRFGTGVSESRAAVSEAVEKKPSATDEFSKKYMAWKPKQVDWSKEGLRNLAAKAYTKFVMREYPVARLAKKAGQKQAELIERQIRRIRGKGGIVEDAVAGKGPSRVNEDGTITYKSSKSLKTILSPLKTKTEYRDYEIWRTAKRDVALYELRDEDQYKDIDVELSRKVIEEISSKYGKDFKGFQAVDKAHRDFETKTILEPLVDIGWLSQKKFDAILNSPEAEFYSSFSRQLEDVETEITGGTGKTPFLYRVKGTKKQLRVIPSVESTISNAQRVVTLVEQQRLNQAVVKLREVSEDLEKSITPMPKRKQGVTITVAEKGKKTYYKVPADVQKVLERSTSNEVSTVIKLLSIPARTLRAGATLSAEFIARNPVRDQFTAMVYAKYGYMPFVDFAKGMFHVLKRTDLFHEYKAAGAEQSYFLSLDRQTTNMTAMDVVGYKKKGKERFRTLNPIEALRIFSDWMERGTRMGVYQRAKQAGASSVEAATESRESTLDFGRIGEERALNQIIAFWNANVQGTDKLIRAFKKAPGRSALRVVAGITLPSIILWALNHDDDRYKELPEWQKNFFWIILTTKDGPIIRIPKPFELGIIFGSLPERILDYLFEKDVDEVKSIVRAVKDGAMPGLIPTAALPVIEHITNYSFFRERPLENLGTQRLPEAMRYTPYTSETAKAVGKAIDISPIKFENWVRGWTGTLGSTGMHYMDFLFGDETPEVAKHWYETAPAVKGFIAREPIGGASKYVTQFYEMLQEITEAQLGYKALQKVDRTEADKFRKNNLKKIRAYKRAGNVSRGLSNLRKRRDRIMNNKQMSSEEKRSRVDSINTRISMISKRFVQVYKK